MTNMAIRPPYPVFPDIDGQPLEAGYIYIGLPNLDPEILANQIAIYFDAALTLPALQPLRTLSGFISNSGTPANIFANYTQVSITVRNKNGSLVYSSAAVMIDSLLGSLALFDSITAAAATDLSVFNAIITQSFHGGWDVTFTGPKGGATYYRDGTSGTASTLYGDNSGFYDTNGNGYSLAPDQRLNPFITGAQGDGLSDDYGAIEKILAFGKSFEFEDNGDYLIDSGLSLSAKTDMVIDFKKSRLSAGSDNLNLLTLNNCSRITIKNAIFDGNRTSSAGSNGSALYILNCNEIIIDSCQFVNNGGQTIQFWSTTSVKDFTVKNCIFEDNPEAFTTTAGCEIYILAQVTDVEILENSFIADTTTPKDIACLIANNTASYNWRHFTANNNFIDGYTRGGIYTSDENPDGTFDNGEVIISNNQIINTLNEGIKTKNNGRVVVTGNILINTDQTPEIAGNLQGAIFVNAMGEAVVSNNVIQLAGSNGIRLVGLATVNGGLESGTGRSRWVISNNVISDVLTGTQGTGGIYVSTDVYECVISDNVIQNCRGSISIAGGSFVLDEDKPTNINISNNLCRGTTSNTAGIMVDDVRGITCENNQVREASGFGLVATDVSNLICNNNLFLDNGQGGVNTHGMRFANITNLAIQGNRSGNFMGVTQAYGITFGGTNSSVMIDGNNFTGNSTADTLGLVQSYLIGNNINLVGNADTAANIASIAAVVNTAGKYAGKTVRDTTNNRLMVAQGSAAGSLWYIADGSASVTPV